MCLAGVLATFGLVSLAHAQRTFAPQDQNPHASQQLQHSQQQLSPDFVARFTDRLLTSFILTDNQGEILLSQLGEKKAQHEDVRNFARDMIKQHSEMDQKLRGKLGSEPHVAMRPAQGAAAVPVLPQLRFDPARTHYDMAQRKLSILQKELEPKQGADFDRAFMNAQLSAHIAMLAGLQTLAEHASPDLKPLVEEAQRHTQQHLDQARDILAKLDNPHAK
jgi:predicted outer membrane protein